MANLRVGVIIGRFQVPELHAGHQALFERVAGFSDQVVAFLGISPIDGRCAENPLTFNQRQAMLRNSLPSSLNLVVLPLPDQRSNEEWSAQIDAQLHAAYPEDDITLYGGRDSFVDSYKGNLRVEHVTHCPAIPDAGTANRAAIREGQTPDFYRGQIYALQHQFPKVYPTVDIAVLRATGTPSNKTEAMRSVETLLIQRADSGRWCFPGGFVDPTDEFFERAAARELQEELGLVTAGGAADFRYAGSFRINDFRYRGSRDKILTTFFTVVFFAGPIVPKYDEVSDYKWVHPLKPESNIVSDTHRPLMDLLRQTYTFIGEDETV